MKKMNHIQLILCGLALGSMLLTSSATYAAVPEDKTEHS